METNSLNTILVVGSGARESALVWALQRGHPRRRVLCTPGNGGIPPNNRRDVKATDLAGILTLAQNEHVDLVVVGPEVPLVEGLIDLLTSNGIKAYGPSKKAALLEGSKIFMKEFCRSEGIPTAPWRSTSVLSVAEHLIRKHWSTPPVIKADGLCGGKGVVVPSSLNEAVEAARQMLVRRIHGEAGSSIVIEDALVGRELSVMALCDGIIIETLPLARDYKRALNGDKGPNTGGMGSYSPTSDVSEETLELIKETILIPIVRGMRKRGTPFLGTLYAGIMLTENGPMLLEINVRLGDPETQVILPRIESDLAEYMLACTELGGLANLEPLKVNSDAAVCIVLAESGYPGNIETGHRISRIDEVRPDTLIFHAGTERDARGELITAGGRVLSVVGVQPTIAEARTRAEMAAEIIQFDGKRYRHDIAAQ